MGLKRKRSLDESPVSISSFAASTPEAQSPTPMPGNYHEAMDLDVSPRFNINEWARRKAGLGSDMSSRTRKRVRDNRPDERVVHENTMQKLFDAQRKHPHAEPIMSQASAHVQPAPAVQKSTLHSFWNLPAPPVQTPTIHIQYDQLAPQSWSASRCEDCDAQLQSDPNDMSMDIDMDMEGGVSVSQFSCNDCGKNVCGTCAVVSNARHCLQCATTGKTGRWW